jgi:hypothetical protein
MANKAEMDAQDKEYKDKKRVVQTADYLAADARKSLRGKQTPAQSMESDKQAKISSGLRDKAFKEQESAAGIPDEIADRLQTQKNEKAYQNYESNRSLGDTFKKGGSVRMSKGGSASKRADGCAIRGKTRA